MNTLEKNWFNVKNSKLCKTRLDTKECYDEIILDEGFESYNDEVLIFTNYAKTAGAQNYKILKAKIIDILDRNKIEADDWEITYIEPNDDIFRLQTIIKNVSNVVIDKKELHNLYKIRNISTSDNEVIVELYFYKQGETMKLVLVDIHHLGIFAKKNGKYCYHNVYDKCKHYNYKINNALKDAKMHLHIK